MQVICINLQLFDRSFDGSEVGADGSVNEEFLAELVTLKKGEENSLLQEGGTSLVIHSDPDDGVSQPSGDSGDRIACGTVEEQLE